MKERISKIKNKSSVLNSNNWTLDPWIYPCITVHHQFIATQALQLDFQNCTACLKSNFQLSKFFSNPCPSWAFISGFTSLHVLDLLKHSFMSCTRLSLNTLACESSWNELPKILRTEYATTFPKTLFKQMHCGQTSAA